MIDSVSLVAAGVLPVRIDSAEAVAGGSDVERFRLAMAEPSVPGAAPTPSGPQSGELSVQPAGQAPLERTFPPSLTSPRRERLAMQFFRGCNPPPTTSRAHGRPRVKCSISQTSRCLTCCGCKRCCFSRRSSTSSSARRSANPPKALKTSLKLSEAILVQLIFISAPWRHRARAQHVSGGLRRPR